RFDRGRFPLGAADPRVGGGDVAVFEGDARGEAVALAELAAVARAARAGDRARDLDLRFVRAAAGEVDAGGDERDVRETHARHRGTADLAAERERLLGFVDEADADAERGEVRDETREADLLADAAAHVDRVLRKAQGFGVVVRKNRDGREVRERERG